MEEPTEEEASNNELLSTGRYNKRSFAELATEDLSRVFFQTISKKVIIDAMPQVRELKRHNGILRDVIRNFQTICPPCVVDTRLRASELYCADCDQPLSCMDWKNQRQLADCASHPERTTCGECDMTLCPECVTSCVIAADEYCATCSHDHAQTCQPCRLVYFM